VGEPVDLKQWAGEGTQPLPLEQIDYRVRYCAADEPLVAGMEALFHAVVTAGSDYPDFLAEVRRVFPELIPR
jgi:hypothetical protein